MFISVYINVQFQSISHIFCYRLTFHMSYTYIQFQNSKDDTIVGHSTIVEMSSAYCAKRPGFKTRRRQEFIYKKCIICLCEKLKLQLGPTFKKRFNFKCLAPHFVHFQFSFHSFLISCISRSEAGIFCPLFTLKF